MLKHTYKYEDFRVLILTSAGELLSGYEYVICGLDPILEDRVGDDAFVTDEHLVHVQTVPNPKEVAEETERLIEANKSFEQRYRARAQFFSRLRERRSVARGSPTRRRLRSLSSIRYFKFNGCVRKEWVGGCRWVDG